jgi:integrase
MASTPGITVRHVRGCKQPADHKPNAQCAPAYQAHLWDRRFVDPETGARGKRIRKTFPTLAAAKAWRQDALPALRKGTMRAPSQTTVRAAWDTWEAGARDGSIRNRSGDVYKPSVLRSYDSAMRLYVLDDLGDVKLSDLQRVHVQDLADRLLARGRDASTIRNGLMPLRVLFRRALARGEVAVNPTTGVELPAVRGRRDRIASPAEAATLIAALPKEFRGLWATALYAGLRRGELLALAWDAVDLDANVIYVRRAYDPGAGVFVEPKSRAGKRKVPIAAALRLHLLEHKARCAWSGQPDGLVFGRTATAPFTDSWILAKAEGCWAAHVVGAFLRLEHVELEPIGLHEARHTFASLMIAAGVNAKALSTYLGHASIAITLDRYGHLMPGNEDEAALLLDAYLERATEAAARG